MCWLSLDSLALRRSLSFSLSLGEDRRRCIKTESSNESGKKNKKETLLLLTLSFSQDSPVVGDDDQGVDRLAERLDPVGGGPAAAAALEGDGVGDDADR